MKAHKITKRRINQKKCENYKFVKKKEKASLVGKQRESLARIPAISYPITPCLVLTLSNNPYLLLIPDE